jgi:hypothetical protein
MHLKSKILSLEEAIGQAEAKTKIKTSDSISDRITLELLKKEKSEKEMFVWEDWRVNPLWSQIYYRIEFRINRAMASGKIFKEDYPYNVWMNQEDAEEAIGFIRKSAFVSFTKTKYANNEQLGLFDNQTQMQVIK